MRDVGQAWSAPRPGTRVRYATAVFSLVPGCAICPRCGVTRGLLLRLVATGAKTCAHCAAGDEVGQRPLVSAIA